jgi:hypothetical protein
MKTEVATILKTLGQKEVVMRVRLVPSEGNPAEWAEYVGVSGKDVVIVRDETGDLTEVPSNQIQWGIDLELICDTKRHLVCLPYSKGDLAEAARVLGLKRHWIHKGYIDIPVRRVEEITSLCRVVSLKEIVRIIKTGG